MHNLLRDQLIDLYDNLRTAALNRKYYGLRLAAYQRINLQFELLIALGTSSAIAAWAVFREGTGEITWLWISGIATILAILKPLVGIPKRIENYTKLFVGHSDVYHDLQFLTGEIRKKQTFTKGINKKYTSALSRIKRLAASDDPQPDGALVNRLYEEVKRELPVEIFWMPERDDPSL